MMVAVTMAGNLNLLNSFYRCAVVYQWHLLHFHFRNYITGLIFGCDFMVNLFRSFKQLNFS